jgi:1-acyl-sn-glycerol-3-phosphate acyltransferase
MPSLSEHLARLSADEMVSALGLRKAPAALRRGLFFPFFALSQELGRTLANLDRDIEVFGLPEAAQRALSSFGVRLHVTGSPPTRGACLVLANHPGAYDALALMAALGREDLLILAADRSFLRALPRLSKHLVFVGETPGERAAALKRAVSCLGRGGALLQFPAGRIEPDAAFETERAPLLEPWQPGVGTLRRAAAKHGASVLVAGVRGVHSPRAKSWAVNRWAEQRGVTTLCPLLQLVGKLNDVVTRVHLEAAPPREEETALRERLQGAARHSAGERRA